MSNVAGSRNKRHQPLLNGEPVLAGNSQLPKLTRKQQAFVDVLVENPKVTATEAVERTYSVSNRNVARNIASENLSKPNIQSALSEYSELSEQAIIGTIKDWKSSENTRRREIATNLAMYTHDKVHGKATQKVEQSSVSVGINIDLTQ